MRFHCFSTSFWRATRALPWALAVAAVAGTPTVVAAEESGWERRLVLEPTLEEGAPSLTAKGGRFSDGGWRSTGLKDRLRVDVLDASVGFEGSLEVTVSNFGPDGLAEAVGGIKQGFKVHFLNGFSNPLADHHAEDGATARDALWTLRTGSKQPGVSRYGNSIKLLYASRGAKHAPEADYHELRLRPPEGWEWDPESAYRFRVSWSRSRQLLRVEIGDHLFGEVPWKNQVEPIRHFYLGAAADYRSMINARFEDLRIYQLTSER